MKLDKSLAPLVCRWFEENRKDLPWRKAPTPYRVWLSEVMLQQTRIETVIPYYFRFLEKIPDINALAEADEETLLLLCAAGEDCCALHYGSKVSSMLGASNLDRLLSDSGMVSQWQTQRYDQSVYSYLQSLLELCKRQNGGQTVYTLPAPAVPQVNVTSQFDANGVWNGLSATEAASDTWNSLHESAEQAAQRETEEKSSGGLSFGEWLVLIVLVLIVFSQSNPLRRARARRNGSYRRYGCGCSPLGWIFSLFGLNVLIDRLLRRR